MRLDHIAYRVADRYKTAEFFKKALGYQVQQEFTIDFGNGQTADCIALEPPEKKANGVPWVVGEVHYFTVGDLPGGADPFGEGEDGMRSNMREVMQDYHLPPEIFVSDGSPGSIVGDWVAARGGIGGIHHIAYQVESVEQTMKEWEANGYAEFTSAQPMRCPGLTQVFTKPSLLTGVIYEFIEREEFGFCKDNVRQLMESTQGL